MWIATHLQTLNGWKAELAWFGNHSGHLNQTVVTCQPKIRESPPAKDRRPNHRATPLWSVSTANRCDLPRRLWSLLNRFTDMTGPLRHVSKKMGPYRQWNVCLRQHPDNVTYRWFLPVNQTRRWSTASTRCRQSCCWLTKVIWQTEALPQLQPDKDTWEWTAGCRTRDVKGWTWLLTCNADMSPT